MSLCSSCSQYNERLGDISFGVPSGDAMFGLCDDLEGAVQCVQVTYICLP